MIKTDEEIARIIKVKEWFCRGEEVGLGGVYLLNFRVKKI